jgi:RNA polymerase sigma-70 factor (ECF subfamily)
MAEHALAAVVEYLQTAAVREGTDSLTDGQLLEAFLARRDEAAFAALVQRHGPMVLGVCRRLLRNTHDAEDCFQATFLVLARKAATIVPRERVASWLYGVARRTALEARTVLTRRRQREQQAVTMPEPVTEAEQPRDWRQVLDEEIQRLPARYRTAVILCELEGRSRKDAARQLRIPEGTLSSRLAEARKMLGRRLTRRGVEATAVAALAETLFGQASAQVPLMLAAATVRGCLLAGAGRVSTEGLTGAALSLAERVLRRLLLDRLKVLGAVLVLLTLLGTAAAVSWSVFPPPPAPEPLTPAPVEVAEEPVDPRQDLEKMQGEWHLVACEINGKAWKPEEVREHTMSIDGDRWEDVIGPWPRPTDLIMTALVHRWDGTFRLDPAKRPREMNRVEGPRVSRRIYKFEGDRLVMCYLPLRTAKRPTEFASVSGGEKQVLEVWQREKRQPR